MAFNLPTIATLLLVAVGAVFATPVLYQGFKRRGKGVRYEQDFLIQRAPQYASVATIAMITMSFLTLNGLFGSPEWLPLVTAAPVLPAIAQAIISWLGVAILTSGLIFMIGGWYSLGECFTTDAEVLDKHTIRKTGLLKYVMHPAYSGIIQSLLGAAVASISGPAILFTLLVVMPLWLNRAKYEEKLMIETFGQSYKEYGEELKWRRLIPKVIPIGV
jgi:protein-S-isoprenylcysteine O-methyltransferase Ste14